MILSFVIYNEINNFYCSYSFVMAEFTGLLAYSLQYNLVNMDPSPAQEWHTGVGTAIKKLEGNIEEMMSLLIKDFYCSSSADSCNHLHSY